MKIIKTLLCALAAASLFTATKVSADPAMNLSGTADFIKAFYYAPIKKGTAVVGSNQVYTTASMTFNQKTIYSAVSNAVANVVNYSAHINPTNLPADGYIAFNSLNYDGNVDGVFYVTNKSGFYYRLSGFDKNSSYYSWIELDCPGDGFYEEGDYDFDRALNENINILTISGTEFLTQSAMLYIHDDPYSYDVPGNNSIFRQNGIVFDLWGVCTISYALKNDQITITSASFKGAGNIIGDTGSFTNGVITAATVRFTK